MVIKTSFLYAYVCISILQNMFNIDDHFTKGSACVRARTHTHVYVTVICAYSMLVGNSALV